MVWPLAIHDHTVKRKKKKVNEVKRWLKYKNIKSIFVITLKCTYNYKQSPIHLNTSNLSAV